VVRARDAEVARVVDQVTGLMLAQELEAVLRRHIDRLHQRLVHGFAQLLSPGGPFSLQYRNSNERHGQAWAWRARVRERAALAGRRVKKRTSGAISRECTASARSRRARAYSA